MSFNTAMDRFVMAIATRDRTDINHSALILTTSEDGIHRTPRQMLLGYNGELTYPTIIDPGGDPKTSGDQFQI